MNKIIIVADLGHFKAFRISTPPHESTKTTLIGSYDFIESHGRLSDKVSDSAGRFGTGSRNTNPSSGYGTTNNIEQENEKRLVKLIAQDINKLISSDDCNAWHLAATQKINKQILNNLNDNVRQRLDKSITANLTKIDKSEILNYFS